MNYNNYIKNKRVILVGPSPILKVNKSYSDFIDSFDVVIKTNAFIENNNNTILHNRYGKKTDVVYINMEYSQKLIGILKNNSDGIKNPDFVIVKSIKPNNEILLQLLENSKIRTAKPFPSFINKYHAAPMLGSIIINDIISNDPMELYITGIDFYCGVQPEDSKYKYGIGNVTKRKKHNYKLNDKSIKHMFMSEKNDIHHVLQDFIYVYDLYINNKIKVDNNLKYMFDEYKIYNEKYK